jgi:hypothetical protein
MMSTVRKETTGGGFLTGEHVKTYFRDYMESLNFLWLQSGGRHLQQKIVVFVSNQVQFLGRYRQRLVLDNSQWSFLSVLRAGGGVTGGGGCNTVVPSVEVPVG